MACVQFRAFASATALLFISSQAYAQQDIDEPQLTPFLFGETEEERREKILKEREEQREAIEISVQQSRDGESLDDDAIRPFLFGDDVELIDDPNGVRVSFPDDETGRSFFSSLTFLVPDETDLAIGLGPVYQPDYRGSDDYQWNIDPQVFVKFRNLVFVDDDGADLALLGFSRFRVGPSIRVGGARDEDQNDALIGLGDVGTAVEVGGFISTTFLNRFNTKVRFRRAVGTGHRGFVAEGQVTALIFRTGPLSLATGAQTTYVGNRVAQTYFSVTPEQSAASGGRLSVYNADGGFQTMGANATAYINIAKRWSFNPYARFNYLLDEYADAPIVNDFGDRGNFVVGFHLMRQFKFKM